MTTYRLPFFCFAQGFLQCSLVQSNISTLLWNIILLIRAAWHNVWDTLGKVETNSSVSAGYKFYPTESCVYSCTDSQSHQIRSITLPFSAVLISHWLKSVSNICLWNVTSRLFNELWCVCGLPETESEWELSSGLMCVVDLRRSLRVRFLPAAQMTHGKNSQLLLVQDFLHMWPKNQKTLPGPQLRGARLQEEGNNMFFGIIWNFKSSFGFRHVTHLW